MTKVTSVRALNFMNKNKILLRIVIVLMVIALLSLVLLLVNHFTNQTPVEIQEAVTSVEQRDPYEDDDGIGRVFYNGQWYVPKENTQTILVMGVDDQDFQEVYENNINKAQADFLMLMIIDNRNETYAGLQLNRDTMTEITVVGALGDVAGTRVAQLALAHTYGSGRQDSCRYTVDAVSNLLMGMEIDHYAALSMDAIAVLNDQVGGVTVTIPEDMTNCDPAFQEGATVTLKGDQAESFVRARMNVGDSTNISRMKRQKIYMDAWKKAVKEKVQLDAEFALQSVFAISEYLISDMTVFQLSDFANALADYEDQGIFETKGENVLGEKYVEFYVDEEALHQQVIELFYERDDDVPVSS